MFVKLRVICKISVRIKKFKNFPWSLIFKKIILDQGWTLNLRTAAQIRTFDGWTFLFP